MYFEEFKAGDKLRTKGRTVTETDVVLFSTISGAYNSLFLDEVAAKKSRFEGRIAPGLLTASIATGLVYQLPNSPFERGFIALLSADIKALKSVRIGDTICCEVLVKELVDKGRTGVVLLNTDVYNHSGEKVMEVGHTIMVDKQPGSEV